MTGFLDRLKGAAQEAATKAKEGIEELQLKHELSQAYGEIGRKAVELVESGELTHPALAEGAEKVRGLKAEIEKLKQAAAEPPAEARPPAQ